MKLKFTAIAVAGLVVMFLAAEFAEAGLTGKHRLRPGKGFHSNNRSNLNYVSRSNSWTPARQSYATPQMIVRSPSVRSAPATVVRQSHNRSANVVRTQPLAARNPCPRGVSNRPRIISERVIEKETKSSANETVPQTSQSKTPKVK